MPSGEKIAEAFVELVLDKSKLTSEMATMQGQLSGILGPLGVNFDSLTQKWEAFGKAFPQHSQQAMTSLQRLGTGIGLLTPTTNTITKDVATKFGLVSRTFTETGLALNTGLLAYAGVAVAGFTALTVVAVKLGQAFADCVMEFAKGQEQLAIVDQLLQNIDSSSGATSSSVRDLADSIADMSTHADDAVIGAQKILLGFETIGPENFERTIRAASDLAILMGGDMPSAADALGRAMQNPEQGIRRLAAQGIHFTKTEQEMLKAMSEANDEAGAQEMILRKVEHATKGLAAAQAGTMKGSIDELKDSWGELKESIGGVSEMVGLPKWFGIVSGFIKNQTDQLNVLNRAWAFMQGTDTSQQAPDFLPGFTDAEQAERAKKFPRVGDGAAGVWNNTFDIDKDLASKMSAFGGGGLGMDPMAMSAAFSFIQNGGASASKRGGMGMGMDSMGLGLGLGVIGQIASQEAERKKGGKVDRFSVFGTGGEEEQRTKSSRMGLEDFSKAMQASISDNDSPAKKTAEATKGTKEELGKLNAEVQKGLKVEVVGGMGAMVA